MSPKAFLVLITLALGAFLYWLTRDRTAQGIDLANRAGTVILQIREVTSEAVQAVSAFANERGGH